MFKKSLIATALVISTIGAFSQAPATSATPASAAAPAKPADVTKVKHEELRTQKAKVEVTKTTHDEKTKPHEAVKAKEVDAKAVPVKDAGDKVAKLVKTEVPAK